MTSSPPQFKPIHAESWMAASEIDDWEVVDVRNCYRFKDGYVQLSKSGYWFPYRAMVLWPKWVSDTIVVNLVKPHVLV